MMPVVRINDATFIDLSTLKRWFGTKSPSETIDRIVREAMEQLGIEHDDEAEGVPVASTDGALIFNTAPSLTFTKPMKASINGKPIQNPNWASILLVMLEQVKAKGYEGEKLVRELAVPTKASSYEEDGYRFFPELGIQCRGSQRRTLGKRLTDWQRSGASQLLSSSSDCAPRHPPPQISPHPAPPQKNPLYSPQTNKLTGA